MNCKFCNDTKEASFLPNSKTIVYFGHEEGLQKQLDKNGMGKLEKKPCPNCAKKVEKIAKNNEAKNANTNRKSKRSRQKENI